MSEYQNVEKPLLGQLAALGWRVIDQGPGFPTDSPKSRRTDFREVTLRETFNRAVRAINLTDDGEPWLTDRQLDELHDQIFHHPGASLLEANEAVLQLLYRAQVDQNELTGEEYPNVKLIDFKHPTRNDFLAINQFRIDTPGGVKSCIIPDVVLFVNGLPLVVIECKDAGHVQANPMCEAFRQLMRYSEQREATKAAGLREGEPRLFYTNAMIVRTNGEKSEFGSITATERGVFLPVAGHLAREEPGLCTSTWRGAATGTARAGDVSPRNPARHRAELYGVHGRRQDAGQDRLPLSTISGGEQDRRPTPHRPDTLQSLRRDPAHPGQRQIADNGLPDPQAADVRGSQGFQGLPDQRPHRSGRTTRQDDRADRRDGDLYREHGGPAREAGHDFVEPEYGDGP